MSHTAVHWQPRFRRTGLMVQALVYLLISLLANTGWAANIYNVAGDGSSGHSGDGGDALSAELDDPHAVAFDSSGNMYIADYQNHSIRVVNTSGTISNFAGDGTLGYSGDGGAATSAELYYPQGLAVDSSDNVFIADTLNDVIRRVDATTGIITTVAGTGSPGYTGDGGLATAAELRDPHGLTFDSSDNLYIADSQNDVIRRVDATTGIITTIAGTGTAGYSGDGGAATAARLYLPHGLAFDSSGNLYIADRNNNRIRKVNTLGVISTYAGSGGISDSGNGGLAILADLDDPYDVVVDIEDTLYVADTQNDWVRQIDATTTIITQTAGNGSPGYNGTGIDATTAEMHDPSGLAYYNGDLYIADRNNHLIRKVAVGPTINNPSMAYAAPVCGSTDEILVVYKDGTGYQDIDSSTAENTSNFSVTNITTSSHSAVGISSATYYSSYNATLLTLSSSMSDLSAYTVTASGIEDVSGNTLPSTDDLMYFSTTESGLVGGFWDASATLSGTPTLGNASTINEELSDSTSGGLLTGAILGLLTGLTCSLLTCADTEISSRWDGFIVPSTTGTHTFELDYNERARIWVDEPRNSSSTLLVEEWSNSLTSSYSDATSSNTIDLEAGEYYPVTVEWAHQGNKDDSGRIVANWTPPSSSKTVIPTGNFKTCISASFDALSSFTVTVPASASACGSATVTVKAVGTSSDPMTTYEGTISLTTNSGHGGWATSGSGILVEYNSDDGSASYTFDPADNGEVTFTLTNRHADVTSVTVTDTDASISATSSDITFEHNGIEINEATSYNWDVVAGRDHSFEVEYTVLNPSYAECQTADFSGTVNLEFWRTLGGNNPPSATAPTISNGTNTYSLSQTSGSATSLPVTITNGVGTFSLITTDIGDFQLNVRDDSSGFVVDSGGSPTTLTGYQTRGSNITVRPFGLLVEATGHSTSHATDDTGDVYVKAGENFTLQVTAVGYDATDDGDSDGLPDGHDDADPTTGADLSDNAALTSFGHVSVGETLTESAALQLPSGGTNGTLSGSLGSFSSGSASGSFNYDEVGIIEITVQSDADFINSGVQLTGKSGYVGRFTPDHFDLSMVTPGLTDGWLDSNSDLVNDWDCDFTYLGQPFGFDSDPVLVFTALNAAGDVTQNYLGLFNKFTGATGTLVDDGYPGGGYGSTLTTPTVTASVDDDEGDGSDDAGIFAMTLSGYTDVPLPMSYSKPDTPSVPFNADFHLEFSIAELTDADGICYEPSGSCSNYVGGSIAGTQLRFGRIKIDESYGSSATDMVLDYAVESYQFIGGAYRFATNTDDNNGCSGTTPPTVALSNYTGQLNTGETTPSMGSIVNGEGSLTLSAPGIDNTGQVDVVLTPLDFLMFDYDGDGTIETSGSDDLPESRATFGVFGNANGHEFFLRESSR